MTNEELTMSNEEAKEIIIQERDSLKANPIVNVEDCLYEAFDVAIKALEQTDKIEDNNFSTEQYKADLQGSYDCGYNCGYVDAMNDIAESEDKE